MLSYSQLRGARFASGQRLAPRSVSTFVITTHRGRGVRLLTAAFVFLAIDVLWLVFLAGMWYGARLAGGLCR